MAGKIARRTFWQLYADHVRPRGALFLGDATLMLFVFLAPAILQVGIKLMAALGAPSAFLRTGETVDGVSLVLAVGLICLDSSGKLVMLAISGWREALQNKQ